MARIELRYATVKIKDGLAGTAASTGTPAMGDTSTAIGSTALNTDVTTKVPVGANFTVAGESVQTVHTVLTRTLSGSNTTNITYSPAIGAGTFAMGAVLTFQPQALSIKVGTGDVKYTENTNYLYDLDRGLLDTVRLGDDQPMDVNFNFVYEHITQGTLEPVAPMDAIKRRNGAAEWVSSATDKCEPYAVDIEVLHTPPCGTSEKETTTFPDFRSDKREVSFKDSNIAITGKCNVKEPIVTRT